MLRTSPTSSSENLQISIDVVKEDEVVDKSISGGTIKNLLKF